MPNKAPEERNLKGISDRRDNPSRTEVTLEIEGIDFHVVYNSASSHSPSGTTYPPPPSPPPAQPTSTAKVTPILPPLPFQPLPTTTTPPRPLILLTHALMANHSMYDSTVAFLTTHGYDTLRYDHLGHNSTGTSTSSWKERKWHFDDFTRHMDHLVKHFTSSREAQLIAIVGCSMGGVLALRYAMTSSYAKSNTDTQTNSPLKIISIGAPGMKSLSSSIPKWKERVSLFRTTGVDDLASLTAKRWFPPPVSPETLSSAEQMCRTCTLLGYEKCAEAITNYDYESQGQLDDLAARKTADVLIIRGENDEAVGPKGILLDVAWVVGGRFVEMKEVGHLPPMHDPEGFEGILLDFLREEKGTRE
jgi:3-oxoadipate enol-lactonase